MSASDYDEHIFRLGQQTLVQLRENGLPPSAENYAVWLNAMLGFMRELALELRQLQQQPGPIDPLELSRLYEKHIIPTDAHSDQKMASFSQTIASTKEILSDASSGAEIYGGTLDAASSRMASVGKDEFEVLIVELAGETEKMRDRTDSLQSELAARQDEVDGLRAELEAARRMSDLDSLTGIANRRCFDWVLNKSVDEAVESSGSLCLTMIDVDHFKLFNDRHGHPIGDIVLRLIGGMLTQQIKGQDLAARYGGEEFAIILPDTDLSGACRLAEKICVSIAKQRPRIKSSQQALDPITLSIGVSEFRPGDTAEELVSRADRALYLAKSDGRNRVRSQIDLEQRTEATAAG